MPSLNIQFANGDAQSQALSGRRVRFGRSPDNDLVLRARGVSRGHGEFQLDGNGHWWIADLRSRNGITVNGRSVDRYRLRHGDTCSIGTVRIQYLAGADCAVPVASSTLILGDQPTSMQVMHQRSTLDLSRATDDRLGSLYDIAGKLMAPLGSQDLIDLAIDCLSRTIRPDSVVVGLMTSEGKAPDTVFVRPRRSDQDAIVLSRSVVRHALDSRQAVVVRDTGAESDFASAQSIVTGDVQSAMCMPMMRDDRVTGFLYLDRRGTGNPFDEADLRFAYAVGAMVSTAVENQRLRETEIEHRRFEAELASARKVQQAVLPSSWPEINGWEVYGLHQTCYEVGGDYYDAVIAPDGRLWLFMADVCGKGAPAALVVSSLHALLHALTEECDSPAALMARLNRLLLHRRLPNSFITAVAMRIDIDAATASICSAGHWPPVHVAASGDVALMAIESNLLLGVDDDVEYQQHNWQFSERGDTVVFYTDGITEAVNEADEMFQQRGIIDTLTAGRPTSAVEAVNAVDAAARQFAGDRDQADDITLLACRRC